MRRSATRFRCSFPSSRGRIDVEAMRAAVTPRTRLALPRDPEQPDGPRASSREDAVALVRELPGSRPRSGRRGVLRLSRAGRRVSTRSPTSCAAGDDAIVLRTFSKLYGLAGLRVGYGVGPPARRRRDAEGAARVRRRALAQVAALASLADPEESARRREANRAAMPTLTAIVVAADSSRSPGAGRISSSSRSVPMPTRLAAALLRHGVAVQSGTPFGAPTSLRIGAGSPAELQRLDEALVASGLSRS